MRTPEEVADLIFANFYVLVQPEVVGTGNHESRALMTDGCLKDLMRTELGQRDAEIRRDTIEKAKDVVRAYADCYQPTDKMLADLDALIQEEETTGSTVDRSEELLNDIRSEIRKSWRKEDERRGSGEA